MSLALSFLLDVINKQEFGGRRSCGADTSLSVATTLIYTLVDQSRLKKMHTNKYHPRAQSVVSSICEWTNEILVVESLVRHHLLDQGNTSFVIVDH